MDTIFLYDLEFRPYLNPPRRKEQCEDALRSFFDANGLNHLMSGLGGMSRTRGVVFRKTGDVTALDRDQFAEFLRKQPLLGTARIGEIEEDTEATDYFREITEWQFNVDNLTDADRIEATKYHKELRQRIQSAASARGPVAPTSD